jgi:hypothetical protein
MGLAREHAVGLLINLPSIETSSSQNGFCVNHWGARQFCEST